MKIVLFGIGKIFEEIKSQIDFHSVVGLIDNEYSKLYQEISGITVVQPERIQEYDYDYIVICNTRYFEDMRNQLIALRVPSTKIIGWQYYLYILKYGVNVLSRNEYDGICDILCKLEIQSILDMENGIERNALYVGDTKLVERVKNVKIYSSEEKYNPNVYCENLKGEMWIDAVVFLDFFLKHSVQEFVFRIEQVKDRTKYIIASIPYPVCDAWRVWTGIDLNQFGEVTMVNGSVLKYFIVKVFPKICDKDKKIYIVSHKKIIAPQNPFYEPIYVGKYDPEYEVGLKDSSGENISHLNEKVNELTAFYWVWKNTRSENVGFCHYRRFFGEKIQFSNPYFGIISKEQAESYLNNVDMIVANAICTYPRNISDQLKGTLNAQIYNECYNLYVDRIKEVCADYLVDFESVMKGMMMYPCNMFYTRWSVFDAYCNWLFSVVTYVAETINVEMCDSYSKRVVGFFAERMLTVWIRHNQIKVKEIEVINI